MPNHQVVPDLLKPIAPKALKALRDYRPWEPPAMGSPEQLLLQAAGYWHTPRRIGHDASLRWLLDERGQAQRNMLATSFLLGVIWERGDLRAALPAYSASLHMPDHTWQGLSAESVSCQVCGQMQQIACDFSFMHLCQWTGSVIAYKPAELAYALQVQRLVLSPQIATLEAHQLAHVRHLGAQRLLAVLQFLDARPPQETPTVLKRHLAKSGLMRWTQQSASEFIGALGFLGVLQPPGHKSFLHEHVSHLAPRKSSSSDWSYPVDFWLGRDGVNWEAVRFWFGELGAESGGLNAPPAYAGPVVLNGRLAPEHGQARLDEPVGPAAAWHASPGPGQALRLHACVWPSQDISQAARPHGQMRQDGRIERTGSERTGIALHASLTPSAHQRLLAA